MDAVPLGLKTAIESGSCVLFLGAGVGQNLTGRDGLALPSAAALAKELAEHYQIATDSYDLSKIAQIVELRKNKDELENFLRKRLASAEPDDIFKWIATIRWKAIFTTNYDNGIERAYELTEKPPQNPKVIATSNEYVDHDPRFEVPVYHIHGALFGSHKGVVITQNDYSRFRERRKMLFEILKQHFSTATFLYIGYSNRDPNWALVLDELSADFSPTPLPHSYRVVPNPEPLDVELLGARNVETVDASFETFVLKARLALSESMVDPDRLGRLKAGVPADLQDAFESNPAAVVRLLNSWEYVNQAAFNETANVGEFLKGNRPNWSTVSSGKYFKRDLEESVFDSLLDYATLTSKVPQCGLIIGPAGYGITTLLMTLAVTLVREGIKPVFFHKPGTALLEGDIEFATTLFKDAPFFIIDDASDLVSNIHSTIEALRNLNRQAYFLLGARRNEWLNRRFRGRKQQFDLEALSDNEINCLIDFLSERKALNNLDGLARDIQFGEIKRRYNKELLVAMREATEGKAFDAIIEDEYRGISEDLARLAYLATCSLYQHGAYVRDSILAKVIGIDHAELYKIVGESADGVILFDCLDEGQGIFGARARHRTIAQIVWERCGDRSTKDGLIHACLDSLNLTYRSDAMAFENLIRSDRVVDEISGLEGKIRFFDTASRKDPDNAYVQQHYARMLLRERQYDLALAKADFGIAMNPRSVPRVLTHTRATILLEMMKEADSDSVARKRLVQAEVALKANISENPRDQYSHQSLAMLYLEWAKRVRIEEESTQYLSKAEEAVSVGLRNVRDREGLWIVSSEIQKWLGDDPERIKALKKAVLDTPSAVVARFLLARALRMSKTPDLDGAIETLKPLLSTQQDEFRIFLEYALALVDLGKRREAIQILELSTLYGHSDPRYLATHGGLLFLEGEAARAQSVFDTYKRKEFAEDELRVPLFRPQQGDGSTAQLRWIGTVVAVKGGYCFIETQGYPQIFCPSSKYGGVAIRPGMKVSFDVMFTARGAIAYFPRLVETS